MATAEPFELRGRKLYQESEQVALYPGDSATVTRRQLRAMQDAVGRARGEGRVTISQARGELAVLIEIRRQLDRTSRPVGIRLAPAEREFGVRERTGADKRKQRRAARQARSAQRKPKKSKSRKRRS